MISHSCLKAANIAAHLHMRKMRVELLVARILFLMCRNWAGREGLGSVCYARQFFWAFWLVATKACHRSKAITGYEFAVAKKFSLRRDNLPIQ